MTLKGVNADWAKAYQFAHVQTHSLQRTQIGFTADTGISLQPSLLLPFNTVRPRLSFSLALSHLELPLSCPEPTSLYSFIRF